jgi:DNA-binding NarL/FixJ family response regulator
MNERKLGKALVVEDDNAWQSLLCEILEEIGLDVTVTDQAEQAMQLIRRHKYHILIADLSLQSEDHRNRDGITILQAMSHILPECISILLTGYATVELTVQALKEYGVYTCLRKEKFNRKEFRQLILQALSDSQKTAIINRSENQDQIIDKDDAVVPSAQNRKKGRVLIVEDDAGWRSILHEILEDENYLVRPCTSYGQAHGLLLHEKFHLAIIDLNLSPNRFAGTSVGDSFKDAYPEGYRLLQLIQAARIPVYVVSGEQRIQAIEDVYRVFNINGYFEKQNFERRLFLDEVTKSMTISESLENQYHLTDRERQVMELLVHGKENKEIAELLVISPNTVKRHIKAVFAKMEVHSRAAAVAAYLSAYPTD